MEAEHPALAAAAEKVGYNRGEAGALEVLEALHEYCKRLDRLHDLPVPYAELVAALGEYEGRRFEPTHWKEKERLRSVLRRLGAALSPAEIASMFSGLSEEDVAEVVEARPSGRLRQVHDLHVQGLTCDQISEQSGIGRTTVYNDLKALGLKPNTKRNFMDPNLAAKIREDRRVNGLSLRALSDKYKLTVDSIKNVLRSNLGKPA